MALNWVIIAVILVLVFLLLKTKEVKHRILTVVGILIVLFVIISVAPILSGANLATFGGVVSAGKLYFSWLVGVFNNLVELTGNALKLDWIGNLTG
jgi:drug/metabolite transporter superfamily protein YnfA